MPAPGPSIAASPSPSPSPAVVPSPTASATALPVAGTLAASLPSLAAGYGGTISAGGIGAPSGATVSLVIATTVAQAQLTPIDLAVTLSQVPVYFAFRASQDFSANGPLALTLTFPAGTLNPAGHYDFAFDDPLTTGAHWLALATPPTVTTGAGGDTATVNGFLTVPAFRANQTYGVALIRY